MTLTDQQYEDLAQLEAIHKQSDDDWLDKAIDGLFGFLAAIGLITVAMAIGLWASGFFSWIANKSGNGVMLFLFG